MDIEEKRHETLDRGTALKIPDTLPDAMRAAQYQHYGSPDELSVVSTDIPSVGNDEVLFKVHASTVNRTDCGFLRGKPIIVRLFSGLLQPKATILGCESAGEVLATGENVTDFELGDRVFCFKDDDFGFGGHAEYTTMNIKGLLAKIPAHLSYEEAAAGLEGSHYALHFIRAANIESGQSVLVNGATGAIGSAAIQIIKHLGAKITAVCAREHFNTVKELGADDLVDYQTQDFTQLTTEFDVVFDAVGKSSFGQSKRILKDGGVYMSSELGPWCQNPLLALWTRYFGSYRVLFPLPVNKREDADYIQKLMADKKFTPLIDRHYSLSNIADAFVYVETGMKTGNVVIQIQ